MIGNKIDMTIRLIRDIYLVNHIMNCDDELRHCDFTGNKNSKGLLMHEVVCYNSKGGVSKTTSEIIDIDMIHTFYEEMMAAEMKVAKTKAGISAEMHKAMRRVEMKVAKTKAGMVKMRAKMSAKMRAEMANMTAIVKMRAEKNTLIRKFYDKLHENKMMRNQTHLKSFDLAVFSLDYCKLSSLFPKALRQTIRHIPTVLFDCITSILGSPILGPPILLSWETNIYHQPQIDLFMIVSVLQNGAWIKTNI